MKREITLLVSLLAVGAASAQTNSATPLQASGRDGLGLAARSAGTNQAVLIHHWTAAVASTNTPSPPTQLRSASTLLDEEAQLFLPAIKPNEIVVGKRTLSGVAAQLARARRPLQLLNPRAAAEYGSGWDNVEERSSGVTGPALRIFAIRF